MNRGKLLVVNGLTASRLVAAVAVVYLVANFYWLPAALLLLSGFATDIADGKLARHWQVTTKWGGQLDAVSDRLLLVSPLIGMMLSGQLVLWLGLTLVIGLSPADLVAKKFGLMRVVWWPICYEVVIFGFVTNVSYLTSAVILALLFVAFAVVGFSKPEEVRKAMATIRHP